MNSTPEIEQPQIKRLAEISWRLKSLMPQDKLSPAEILDGLEKMGTPHLQGETQEEHDLFKKENESAQERRDLIEEIISIGQDVGFTDASGKALAELATEIHSTMPLVSRLYEIAWQYQTMSRGDENLVISDQFFKALKEGASRNPDLARPADYDEINQYVLYLSLFCQNDKYEPYLDVAGRGITEEAAERLFDDFQKTGEPIHLDYMELAVLEEELQREDGEKILDPKYVAQVESHLEVCDKCNENLGWSVKPNDEMPRHDGQEPKFKIV